MLGSDRAILRAFGRMLLVNRTGVGLNAAFSERMLVIFSEADFGGSVLVWFGLRLFGAPS